MTNPSPIQPYYSDGDTESIEFVFTPEIPFVVVTSPYRVVAEYTREEAENGIVVYPGERLIISSADEACTELNIGHSGD